MRLLQPMRRLRHAHRHRPPLPRRSDVHDAQAPSDASFFVAHRGDITMVG